MTDTIGARYTFREELANECTHGFGTTRPAIARDILKMAPARE